LNRWETKARCDVFASILTDTLSVMRNPYAVAFAVEGVAAYGVYKEGVAAYRGQCTGTVVAPVPNREGALHFSKP
jgi:hypothetical protein